MLSLEHLSPSVITQRSLKGLLLEIKNHLPEYLKLQYHPKGEIWKLYHTLPCTTALDKARFLVIVSIPLLDNMYTLEIFNIFNMPIPVEDPVVPTDKLPSMVPWYILDIYSTVVNLVQMEYVFDSYRTGTLYIPFTTLL